MASDAGSYRMPEVSLARSDSYRRATTPGMPPSEEGGGRAAEARKKRQKSKVTRAELEQRAGRQASKGGTMASYYSAADDAKSAPARRRAIGLEELRTDDHIVDIADLYERFDVDPALGQSEVHALEMIERGGYNEFSAPVLDEGHAWAFLTLLFSGYNRLLWAAVVFGIISYWLQWLEHEFPDPEPILGAFILAIVASSYAITTYLLEMRGSRALDAFRRVLPLSANVLRDGERKVVPSRKLVLGDMVDLRQGDIVPADVRIVEAVNLRVNNSIMSGVHDVRDLGVRATDKDMYKSTNVALMGSQLLEGNATAVVMRVGDRTELGKLVARTAVVDTLGAISSARPLGMRRMLSDMSVVYSTWLPVILILAFAASYYIEWELYETCYYACAIICSLVPLSLPGLHLYGQLRSTALLRDNHQLSVKEPSLLGNLARLNTLVLDIASLSQHDGAVVEVSDAWAGGRRLRGANDSADDLRSSVVWQYLCRALALCNSAFVGLDTSDVPLTAQHNSLNIIDRALVRFLRDESETTSIEELRRAHERLFQTGVEAGEPRLQVSVHEDEQSYLLLMRGPVESVLARCSTLVVDDAELDLSEQYRIEAHKAYQRLAQDGSAVIAFAELELSKDEYQRHSFDPLTLNFPTNGLRLLGLVGVRTWPSSSFSEHVGSLRKLGVRVILASADDEPTAIGFARTHKLIGPLALDEAESGAGARQRPVVLSGDWLGNKAETIVAKLKSARIQRANVHRRRDVDVVVARTSPEQRLLLLDALKMIGDQVAVYSNTLADIASVANADIA